MTDVPARARPRRLLPWSFDSGPAVATLFAQLFAIVSIVAWLSLGSQVQLLIGSHGLLPVGDLIDAARSPPGVSFLDLPTIFWRFHSDAALKVGVAIGATLSVAALLGFKRRLCFAISTALYLSYATVGRDFLSFQWDNLLLECGFLAAFLPTDAPAPLVHFLFRVLLFKLYFESGIAKWQSPLHDWHDGSAMTIYYETAPLPTWLAFYAHHLPLWWHHFESRATLVLELVVPLAIFGPRPARLGAAVVFTLFQLANAATANYGFFCYLAAALHLFLLDDADVKWFYRRLKALVPATLQPALVALGRLRRLPQPGPASVAPASMAPASVAPAPPPFGLRWLARGGAACLLLVSLAEAMLHFGEPGRLVALLAPVLELDGSLRIVNTYHLFAAITRERIEPEIQTLSEGAGDADGDAGWVPQYLHHKPGDLDRAPDFVAPHQPRVDFQLWFYGLSFRRREPAYVAALVARTCNDPAAVQPLFAAPLPSHPAAVRIVFWQYVFSTAADRRATGAWWRRTRIATSRAISCPSPS